MRLVLNSDKIDSIYLLLLTKNLKWWEINEWTTATSRNRRRLYAILYSGLCINEKRIHASHTYTYLYSVPSSRLSIYQMDYGKSTFASKW